MIKQLLAALPIVLAANAAQADVDKATQALRTLVPEAPIESVSDAPIEGFYEMVVNGNILYVSEDGKYLIQGMVFDIDNRVDLTEARKAGIRLEVMQDAPVAERIVFPAKDKKYTVTVFTDIDCGYCRKLHEEVPEYNALGIEVEYMWYPRAGIGSDSYRKAVAVWCDKDQQGAMDQAKAGVDPGNRTCTNPIEAQYNLGGKAGINSTPSMIFENGVLAPGYMPPDQLLQRLQQMEASNATASTN